MRARPAPKLSDAELICLAVAQVLLGYDSERHWLRFASQRLGHLFPYLPTSSAYNRRLRRTAALVCLTLQDIAAHAPKLGRLAPPGRLHSGAVRGQPPDGPPVGTGRPRRLRLLQQPPPLFWRFRL